MNKKKIAFVIQSFPSRSETFIVYQIANAILLGFEVSILVKRIQSEADNPLMDVIDKFDLMNKVIVLNDLRPKRLWMYHFYAFYLFFQKVPTQYFKTFNVFKFGLDGLLGKLFYGLIAFKDVLGYDIIHIQFGTNAYPIPKLKKHGLIKTKMITTFHGVDAHYTKENYQLKIKSYKELFEYGDHFTVNTKYLAEKITSIGCPKGKLTVMPMAGDTDFFKPQDIKKNTDSFSLISVGRLIELKGHHLGIEVVEVLKSKEIDVKYTIVGMGERFDYLEQMVRSKGLESNVDLVGNKSRQEIRELLCQSDVYLMTSIKDSEGRSEAQGLVTIEAQSCGLPVVAFDTGGVAETIVENKSGFLCVEGDVGAMCEFVEQLMSNHELYRFMAFNGRKHVINNYSLEGMKDRQKKLYD